jgi:hypothetical protein
MTTTPRILTLAVRRGRRYVAVHVHTVAARCYTSTNARERARSGRLQTFFDGVSENVIRALVSDDSVRTYPSLKDLCEDVFADVTRATHLDVA